MEFNTHFFSFNKNMGKQLMIKFFKNCFQYSRFMGGLETIFGNTWIWKHKVLTSVWLYVLVFFNFWFWIFKVWWGKYNKQKPKTVWCPTQKMLKCEGLSMSQKWENDMRNIGNGTWYLINIWTMFYRCEVFFQSSNWSMFFGWCINLSKKSQVPWRPSWTIDFFFLFGFWAL